jgi:hypothetical protein
VKAKREVDMTKSDNNQIIEDDMHVNSDDSNNQPAQKRIEFKQASSKNTIPLYSQ